jgi:hypothetical protein
MEIHGMEIHSMEIHGAQRLPADVFHTIRNGVFTRPVHASSKSFIPAKPLSSDSDLIAFTLPQLL